MYKKLCKAHAPTKLKHTRFFTKTILVSNNQYMHLLLKRTLTRACQMYVTITCIQGSNVHFILLLDTSSTDKCTGRWCRGSTPKDELPEPRETLANDIPSHAI